MKITNLNISANRIGGLGALKVNKLGKTVVVAGKNGAGKSRILQFISKWKTERPNLDCFSPETVVSLRGRVTQLKTRTLGSWNDWALEDASWNQLIKRYSGDTHDKLVLSRDYLNELIFDKNDDPQIINFVPKKLILADPREQKTSDLVTRAKGMDVLLGMEKAEHNVLARIQYLQNVYREVTHQGCALPAETVKKSIDEYESMQDLIQRFLGTKLERSHEGDATLFGLPIGAGCLSDGQSVLLQFCLAIHAQAKRLSELIIVMDEPENHLHPSVMLDAINEISRHLVDGQLWIATHSLPLLANFDPDCIWWMNDGILSHAGSAPEIVLRGLLGGQENIDRLEAFLGLPNAIAINNFAAQCLLPPNVVVTGTADPQLNQITTVLKNLRGDKIMKILDVGAGRGRLISALGSTMESVTDFIDYYAYDPSSEYKNECEDAIGRLYLTNDKRRWFGTEQELRAELNQESLDLILMCNVLHEIEPQKWIPDLFSKTGIVTHLLHQKGFLLVVEDTEMRIGEKAHDNGFLVLSTHHLRKLFSVTDQDSDFKWLQDKGGRLIATLVPAPCLGRVTQQTLKFTLSDVAHDAAREINRIRKAGSSTFRDGRRLAYYMQQFANAKLTLEAMGEF